MVDYLAQAKRDIDESRAPDADINVDDLMDNSAALKTAIDVSAGLALKATASALIALIERLDTLIDEDNRAIRTIQLK